MKLRILTIAVFAACCSCAFAASASAVTIGSSLSHQPNNGTCMTQMIVNSTSTCTTAQTAMAPSATASGGLTAPADGVVVRWRVLANNGAPGSLKLAPRVFAASTPQVTGATVDVGASSSPQEFPTRLRIKAGQSLGLDITTTGMMMTATVIYSGPSSEGGWLYWGSKVVDGATVAPDAANNDIEVLMNADIEPDADNDGFGDVTQDQCLGVATANGLCPDAPPVLPLQTITNPILSRDFKSLFFSASVTASLPIKLERLAKGRKSGGKCKTGARKGKKCTFYKPFTRMTADVTAGLNKLNFKPLRGPRPLGPGTYRLTFGSPAIKTLKFSVKPR